MIRRMRRNKIKKQTPMEMHNHIRALLSSWVGSVSSGCEGVGVGVGSGDGSGVGSGVGVGSGSGVGVGSGSGVGVGSGSGVGVGSGSGVGVGSGSGVGVGVGITSFELELALLLNAIPID